MMHRKGMEVSINFIVILIISIVVLGFGISTFTTLFQESEEFQTAVTENNKARLDAILDSGDPVAVLRNVREIRPGEDEVFSLAVGNEESSSRTFKVEINALRTNPPGGTLDVLYPSDAFTLGPKDRRYVPFKIAVGGGTPKGSYVFNVTVCEGTSTSAACDGSNTYFHPVNVYVNVP